MTGDRMTADRALRVLLVCTANVCRSPLAHAFTVGHAAAGAYPIKVASASVDTKVRHVHPLVETILGERGQQPARSISQPLSNEVVDASDLILTMTGDHAIAVAGQFRAALFKVFMLDHFVTTARPKHGNESLDEWLDAVRRLPRTYPNQPGATDVPDPVNKDEATFRSIAATIDDLTARLTRLLAN